MQKLKCFLAALISLSVLSLPGYAADEDPMVTAIKVRQGYFRNVRFNFGPLVGMAKGELDYDAELAAQLANNLSLLSQMDIGRAFPEDSSNELYDQTRALPEIWSTYPEIKDKFKTLREAAASIKEAAGGGLDSLKPAVVDLGEACKGCHDKFREE